MFGSVAVSVICVETRTFSCTTHALNVQVVRQCKLRGIVPDSFVNCPVIIITIRFAEDAEVRHIEAAVSDLRGIDVLVGMDVLKPMFEQGYHLA